MFSLIRYAVAYLKSHQLGLLRDERGVTTIEYGILAAGLAIIITALVGPEGQFSLAMDKVFDNIISLLPQGSEENPSGNS
ncbi:MAG: Flp family type IVb pilin [Deltaproteobacteria bacterium]|jgi:pilus assembly protein Flp/PilA|nr:Flp family type IVb pilin [Deltaproteobacteria bacterium]